MKKHFLTVVLLSLFSSLFAEDVSGPFMTEKWDQCDPYNSLCPMYLWRENGEMVGDGELTDLYKGRAPTGCVATQMAQVMHYWQWPTRYDSFFKHTHPVTVAGNKNNYSVELESNCMTGFDFSDESIASRLSFFCASLGELFFTSRGTGGNPSTVANKLSDYYYIPPSSSWYDVEELLKLGYPIPMTIEGHAIVAHGWKNENGQSYIYMNKGYSGANDGWLSTKEIKTFHVLYPKKMALLDRLPNKAKLPLAVSWSFPAHYSEIYAKEFKGFRLTATMKGDSPVVDLTLDKNLRSYTFDDKQLEYGNAYTIEIVPIFNQPNDFTAFDPKYPNSACVTIDSGAPNAPTLKAVKTLAAPLARSSFEVETSPGVTSLNVFPSVRTFTQDKTVYALQDHISTSCKDGVWSVVIDASDYPQRIDSQNVILTIEAKDANDSVAYAETIVNFSAANTGNNSGTDPEEKPGTDPTKPEGTDPDYILISPKNFVGYWQEYIAARKAAHPDMTFAVKNAAEIYAEYKDLTPAEKIKEYIAARVKNGTTKYIVLGGAWSNITTDDGKSEESFILPGDNGDKYKSEALSLDNTIPGFTETFGGKTLATDYLYALIDEDNKPDVVVSRIPLVPWPKADGSVSSFSDIIAGYAKKVAAVEDAAFQGTHRYACAGAQLGSSVARGSAYWPTERHRYADGYYDFYDANHPDSVADGMIAARRRFRDYFAKYNPVKGAMVIPLGNAATDFFADKSGWEAIVAKCHGLEGEAYQTGITDTLFRETSTIVKFGIFAMPCLTGSPDRTSSFGGWSNMRYPSMGVAAICNPNGGEVVGFHNTHDGAGKNDVALVTTCGDPYATQYEGLLLEALFKPNEKGERLNAGDAWKKAHCDYIEKFGSGTWHLWTAYESLLYGDPLVSPSVVNEPVCGEGAVPARVLFK